jgi:Cysteine dioxygenase type I
VNQTWRSIERRRRVWANLSVLDSARVARCSRLANGRSRPFSPTASSTAVHLMSKSGSALRLSHECTRRGCLNHGVPKDDTRDRKQEPARCLSRSTRAGIRAGAAGSEFEAPTDPLDAQLGNMLPSPGSATPTFFTLNEQREYSLQVLLWQPGSRTPIHDHTSWGVYVCLAGQLVEDRYPANRRRLAACASEATARLARDVESRREIDPAPCDGGIHRVWNSHMAAAAGSLRHMGIRHAGADAHAGAGGRLLLVFLALSEDVVQHAILNKLSLSVQIVQHRLRASAGA